MIARLASAVLVSALVRRAQAEGGFAAVLAKGDAMAGAIAVILAERGQRRSLLERLLQADGTYAWREATQDISSEESFRQMLDRKRDFDPDLWILELDVASAERFAAEMNAIG